MSEELKPCRYCGKQPDVNSSLTSVWCTSLRDECPYTKLAMSPDEWNTRPIEDTLRAEFAAAHARAEKIEADRQWLAEEIARRSIFGDCRNPQYWLEEAEYQVAAKREEGEECTD